MRNVPFLIRFSSFFAGFGGRRGRPLQVCVLPELTEGSVVAHARHRHRMRDPHVVDFRTVINVRDPVIFPIRRHNPIGLHFNAATRVLDGRHVSMGQATIGQCVLQQVHYLVVLCGELACGPARYSVR